MSTTITTETKLIRSKSGKYHAIASGTLAIRVPLTNNEDMYVRAFEEGLKGCPSLRPLGPIATKATDAYLQVGCRVAYGPVYGAYKADLRRGLELISAKIGAEVFDQAVLDFEREELRTREGLTRAIDALAAQASDPKLSLAACEQLTDTIGRLRRDLDSLK